MRDQIKNSYEIFTWMSEVFNIFAFSVLVRVILLYICIDTLLKHSYEAIGEEERN